MKIKPGVRVLGLRPELLLAIIAANDLWLLHGSELVITSVIDGTHSVGSKHYSGCGVDFRTSNLSAETTTNVVRALKEGLGEDYDVVLENDHVHVEFDPKKPY